MPVLHPLFKKILILWIVFGTPFFEAIDAFVLSISEKLTDSVITFSASNLTAIAFISIYALGGLAIGILITQIPSLLNKNVKELSLIVGEFEQLPQTPSQRKSKRWTAILMLFLFVIAFAFQYFVISSDAALSQLIRTLTIVGLWFILVQPLIKWAIRSIAKKNNRNRKTNLNLFNQKSRFI